MINWDKAYKGIEKSNTSTASSGINWDKAYESLTPKPSSSVDLVKSTMKDNIFSKPQTKDVQTPEPNKFMQGLYAVDKGIQNVTAPLFNLLDIPNNALRTGGKYAGRATNPLEWVGKGLEGTAKGLVGGVGKAFGVNVPEDYITRDMVQAIDENNKWDIRSKPALETAINLSEAFYPIGGINLLKKAPTIAELGTQGINALSKSKTLKQTENLASNPNFFVTPEGTTVKDLKDTPLMLPASAKQAPFTQVKYTTMRAPKKSNSTSVLYHGGNVDPKKFEISKSSPNGELGQGFYASEKKGVPEEWAKERNGKVYQVEMDTSNFFDEFNVNHSDPRYQKVKELLMQKGISKNSIDNDFGGEGTFEWFAKRIALKNPESPTMFPGSNQMAQILKEAGFDGAIAKFRDGKQYVSYTDKTFKNIANKKSQQIGEGIPSTKTILPKQKQQTLFNAYPNKETPFKATIGETPQGSINPFKKQGNIISQNKGTNAQNGAQSITGNIDTARQKISYNSKEKPKIDGLFAKLRTQLVDKFAPLENLEKNIRGKINSAESSLYKQARLNEGVPERANVIVEKELKPIIKSIEEKGYSYKDLELYAEMVHAKDVNAAGMNSGFTNAEIDDVIRKLGTPEMETARKQLVEYSNKRLQTLADSQVISKASYDAMRSKWSNYMPLNRAFDDDKVEFVSGLGKSLANVSSPIKTLTGSERNVVSPIESLIKNTYKIENAASRNKAGLQLSKLATEDTDSRFIRKLAPGEEVGRRNVVNIKENGQNVQYEVEPDVYKAMLDMNRETSPLWIKAMSAPASILRAGATLTPDFALRNPIRDVMNAFIVSKSGFNPFTDFAAGLGSYIKKGKLYEEFLRNNGGYGNIISMDRQAHKEALERVLKTPTWKNAVNIVNPAAWVRVMRTISDATESATKIGEFRAALRSGATKDEAAYRARDLMDFARSGSSVKEFNKVVAFLNANIQGKSKFIRAIKEDPIGVGGRLFATMAVPSIGAYALNNYFSSEEQKATIKDAPAWLKNSFWLIAIPGTDTLARIPKPFEGAAVANTLERFLDYVVVKDKEAFDGFMKETVQQQSIPIMMNALTPFIEGMANYSFFRQAPIIPEREKYLQPQDQYDIYTSEVSKKVAGLVQKVAPNSNFASPRVIENTIKGTTAGLGTYALEGIDLLSGKNKPSKNANQLPVFKAFAVNDKATGKSMEFIYNEKERLTKERGSFKLANTGKPYPNEAKYKYINRIADQIGNISSEIRKVQNDKSMTPQEKRDKINELSDKRNKLTRESESYYKLTYSN